MISSVSWGELNVCLRRSKISVDYAIVINGEMLYSDNFCVLLRRDGQSQLVYKHAISTIMPSVSISLYDGEE